MHIRSVAPFTVTSESWAAIASRFDPGYYSFHELSRTVSGEQSDEGEFERQEDAFRDGSRRMVHLPIPARPSGINIMKTRTSNRTAKTTTPHQTQNDLPARTRVDVIEILNARLADSIDLMHQAKQAHWNVKGRNFIALHKLFDEIVDEAEEYMDLLAERVVQLGGTAEGTIQAAAQRTELKGYPLRISKEQDHVAALSAALAAYGKRVRRAIDQTDQLGDKDSADIFTEISRGADKYLWFVESHLTAN